MSFTIHGIGVSGGIAIGRAHLVSHTRLEVAHYEIPPEQITEEIARFDLAIRTVREELGQLRGAVPAGAPAEFAAFIDLPSWASPASGSTADRAPGGRGGSARSGTG